MSMMSLNVMYFCGKFEKSFNQSIIDQPFYIDEKNTKRVKCMSGMMNQLFYGMIPELKTSFIELPYEVKNNKKYFSDYLKKYKIDFSVDLNVRKKKNILSLNILI